jgi:ABC-type oligopeptide transport system ATPase subunit
MTHERPAVAVDLLDFLYIAAGAAYPPLLLLAFGQWFLRRSAAAGWLEGVGQQALARASLPDRQQNGAQLTTPNTQGTYVPWSEWKKRVLESENIIVVGAPGDGKTTLTRAFLPLFAAVNDILILDPHDLRNDWPWTAVGSGRDYGAIVATLEHLTDEMDRRYKSKVQVRPLLVVIDEVPSVTLYAKKAWEEHYPPLVFEGRKVGIHTWVMTQSAQVRPLGLEGKGDLRKSLTWVYLGEFAVEKCPQAADLEFPAAIEFRGRINPIDTSALPTYARLNVQAERQYALPERSERSDAVQPHLNAAERTTAERSERSVQEIKSSDMMTPDERSKTEKAIELYTTGKSKQAALEQAWGIRKGGSAGWKRASTLFDGEVI